MVLTVMLVNFMNKDIIKFVVKVLLYALGLVGSYLGVTSLTSCSVQRDSQSSGHARIVITDTTDIVHSGNFYFRPGRRR